MKTKNLGLLTGFYTEKLGCRVWLEQADCVILRHGNFLFGFCDRDAVDKDSLLTFFYETREEVDRMYEQFRADAESPPASNEKYDIYQFFAKDPEGRRLEFQYFEHSVDSYLSGDELLLSRRSVRSFEDTDVPDDVLEQLFEICRYAPTSMNTQSYYFKLIRDPEIRDTLSNMRGKSSRPIAKGPLSVAICSDPGLSKRHIQDGCIAAYHFVLAAWSLGLGTCWIAAMDRDDAKDILGIPNDHYIATITPLGYPKERAIRAPERKESSWVLRDPK
jgi:nitroreductase